MPYRQVYITLFPPPPLKKKIFKQRHEAFQEPMGKGRKTAVGPYAKLSGLSKWNIFAQRKCSSEHHMLKRSNSQMLLLVSFQGADDWPLIKREYKYILPSDLINLLLYIGENYGNYMYEISGI